MSTGNSGAVFFLGSRAHYQVLQQPETRYDVENGNASTETIYQNPSVQELWTEDNSNCYDNDVNMSDEKDKTEPCNGMKWRAKRRQSETALCERDDMKPALLNNVGDSSTPKPKSRRRMSVLSFLSSLAKRRRKLDNEQQYLQHLESALTTCTYRESCRCLDCQSRYFECDESEGYSSDESDYSAYTQPTLPVPPPPYEDDDDEVFIDTVPGDNTSTDMLLETKEPPTQHSSCADDEDAEMQLEVAAGTPVLLNYLLTHPVTCVVQ